MNRASRPVLAAMPAPNAARPACGRIFSYGRCELQHRFRRRHGHPRQQSFNVPRRGLMRKSAICLQRHPPRPDGRLGVQTPKEASYDASTAIRWPPLTPPHPPQNKLFVISLPPAPRRAEFLVLPLRLKMCWTRRPRTDHLPSGRSGPNSGRLRFTSFVPSGTR